MSALSSLSNQSLRMEILHLRRDLSDHFNEIQIHGDYYGSKTIKYSWKVARLKALEVFADAQLNISLIEQQEIAAFSARWIADQRNHPNRSYYPPQNKPRNRKRNKRNRKNAVLTSHAPNSTQRAIEGNNNIAIKQERVDDSSQPTVQAIGSVVIKQEKDADSNKRLERIGNIFIKQEKVDDGYQQFAEPINKSIQKGIVGNKRKCSNADESNVKKAKSQ